MGRRNDHSREEIRELALQAASDIVTEQGMDGLSARKIATAIGYTVGSLYLVFENLDDLILHMNARYLDAMHEQVTQAARECETDQPEVQILALGRAYLDFALAHPHNWRMIFEHRMQNGEPVPVWYLDKVLVMFKLIETPLSTLMSKSDSHTVSQTARALWGGVQGICVLSMTGKLDVVGGESVRALLDMLIQNFLKGLTAET